MDVFRISITPQFNGPVKRRCQEVWSDHRPGWCSSQYPGCTSPQEDPEVFQLISPLELQHVENLALFLGPSVIYGRSQLIYAFVVE